MNMGLKQKGSGGYNEKPRDALPHKVVVAREHQNFCDHTEENKYKKAVSKHEVVVAHTNFKYLVARALGG